MLVKVIDRITGNLEISARAIRVIEEIDGWTVYYSENDIEFYDRYETIVMIEER